MEFTTTFQRTELKCLLTREQKEGLLPYLREHTHDDRFGPSTIGNIYCDTPDFKMIRHSIEGPIFKEKLRIRAYGVPEPEGRVFVEIKRKYEGIVYKRRIDMTWNEAASWLKGGQAPRDTQIQRELDYFRDFYHPIPAAGIFYDRIPLVDNEFDLRLTLDTNLRWRTEDLDLTHGFDGELLLPEGMGLLEVKGNGALPFWFLQAIRELDLRKTSFSKYGALYERELFPELSELWTADFSPLQTPDYSPVPQTACVANQ